MPAATEAGSTPRVRLTEAALVVAAALVSAVVYTYPLVLHFGEAIPYACRVPPERTVQGLVPGDPLQFLYFLSVTDDMVRGRAPWFQDPYEFSAPEASTRRSFFFLPFSLLFAAVAPLGKAAAYNVLVLLSFPATALATYLLALRLGADRLGGLVAAAVLTWLPYRLANVAGGHPTGVVFFLLPLAFYGLEVAWQEKSVRGAAVAGLAVACLAVNEPHFFYFCGFLLPLWFLFAVWRLEPTGPAPRSSWSLAWLALAALGPTTAAVTFAARRGAEWTSLGVVLLYALVAAFIAVAWRVSGEIRARDGEPGWEAEARSYAPLVLLALYPMQVALDVPHLGALLLVGTATVLLVAKRALLAAAMRLVLREASRLRALWPAAAGFVAGGLLLLQWKSAFIDPSQQAAGRSLREIRLFAPRAIDFLNRSSTILSRQLYPGIAAAVLSVPALARREGRALLALAFLFGAMALGPNAPLWLPLYSAARHFVPFFGIIRQPGKLFAVTAFAVALAAGLGATVLGRRLSRRGRIALGLVAIAAIALDFSSLMPFGVTRLPRTNAAYARIAERGRGTNLLELPLWPGDSAYSSIYQYWATETGVPIVNGYSATAPRDYIERVVRPLESMNLGELAAEQERLLDDLRVRFVTLHRDTYPPQVSGYSYRFALAAMRENPNFREAVSDAGVYLFERVSGAYRPWRALVDWPIDLFYEAEALKLGAGEVVRSGETSAGAAVHGTDGDRPLVYGPYRPLPAGRYEARFRARGSGRVEVVADLGKAELGAAAVDGTAWREVPVAFELDRPRTLEFRAWAGGADHELDVDWVLLHRASSADGKTTVRFEAEDLTALYGDERESPDASGGAYADVVDYPPGVVVRDGPYRLVDPGRWRIAVRSRGGPFRVHVESADGRRRLAEIAVAGAKDWQTSDTSFDVRERMPLSTRLVSTGHEAGVDYVELSGPRSGAGSPTAPATGTADGAAMR